MFTKGYKRFQGLTVGYNGLQWVTRSHKGFPGDRRGTGYKGFKGLQEIKGDYKELQGVTGGYMGL